MKKTIYLFASVILLLSCKKESSNPTTTTTTTTTNSTDTTKKPTVSNIDFSAVGTPIGKFGNGVTDIEGNKYKTVILGKQEWMAENLKTTKYNDGSIIPLTIDTIQWVNKLIGAYCNYANKDSIGNIYGKLYNWYTVYTKKVCPTGWHVPDDNEWSSLISYLGGEKIDVGILRENGTNHWKAPDNYTTTSSNRALFTALPGGLRFGDIKTEIPIKYSSLYLEYHGYWWSSTENQDNYYTKASYHTIDNNNYYRKDIFLKKGGMSIRCIKD
jgi:uncharacterized protein (TIGR02145 family)